MTLLEILFLLLIAAFTGGIGQSMAGYTLGGFLVSIVVGFIGAFIGLWLARQFSLPLIIPISVGGRTFPLIWSALGSALLTLILGTFTRGR